MTYEYGSKDYKNLRLESNNHWKVKYMENTKSTVRQRADEKKGLSMQKSNRSFRKSHGCQKYRRGN